MKLRVLCTLALTSSVLSSCIYYTQPMPEMPYQPYRPNPAAAQANTAAYAAASQYEGAWYTTPAGTLPTATPLSGAAIPPPTAAPQPSARPATISVAPPKPATSTAITQPQLKPVTPKPAVAATPKPAPPAPTPATPAPTAAAKDPKTITNTGPIPVATPVPGDPTRVYNPLDSSKTIRITDKNGKVYPSGKELKVRGTNFHFYVP